MGFVELTETELKKATAVGERRQAEAKRMRLADKHGFIGDGAEIHVLGAQGELACAKVLGLTWDGDVNTFKRKADLLGTQVRTRTKPWHELIVRRDDPDGDRFALMIKYGQRTFEYKGSIVGSEAKRSEWLRTHGDREKAYFVPHEALWTEGVSDSGCPKCGALGFRKIPLGKTVLLICADGCRERSIALVLGLENWP